MQKRLCLIALMAAAPAAAEETRQMEAHQHGIGSLNLALDGNALLIELEVPGADIVGFEHAAESDEDRAAVEAAIEALSTPSNIFELPAKAECSVTSAAVELENGSEHEHEEHAHEEHAEGEHAHEEHAEGEHEHEEHAQAEHNEGEHKHEEHAHEEDAEGEHEHEHEHEDHAAGHSEFHAQYVLECAAPDALAKIEFGYFDLFENAKALEVQALTTKGAKAADVTREAPVLDLQDLL